MPTYTYYSTDTGIPVKTGQAGANIAIYDAVLVNGFNSKTGVTIARTGSVATATKTAHGYRNGQILLMSGATQTEYNGLFRISNVTTNTWDFTVTGTPATPATGAPASIVAPAGWTKPFSGTNKAVYRSPAGTNQFYYRIDDSGTTTSRLIGYETMTDVDTGTGLFPTAVQLSGGLYLQKSSTADATARPYVIITNGKIVYERVRRAASSCSTSAMGDYTSRKSGDAYGSLVAGAFSAAFSSGDALENSLCTMGASSSLYTVRSYTQVGSALTLSRYADERVTNALCGSAGYTFPHPVDGALDLAQVRLFESTTLHRGWLPGFFNPMHNLPLTDLDVFSGTGAYSARSFIALSVGVSATGQIFIETSDTW
jgi:hypothetical protein